MLLADERAAPAPSRHAHASNPPSSLSCLIQTAMPPLRFHQATSDGRTPPFRPSGAQRTQRCFPQSLVPQRFRSGWPALCLCQACSDTQPVRRDCRHSDCRQQSQIRGISPCQLHASPQSCIATPPAPPALDTVAAACRCVAWPAPDTHNMQPGACTPLPSAACRRAVNQSPEAVRAAGPSTPAPSAHRPTTVNAGTDNVNAGTGSCLHGSPTTQQ